MESYDLNSFPEKIRTGVLSQKDAINNICSFISKNYRVFNLQKYDEDFRSELIVSFLENGVKFLNSYNPEIGDFFTFLYCYINSMVSTRIRALSLKTLKETVTLSEGITSLQEKEYKYSRITHHISEIPKAPYAYKPTNIEELKKVFANISSDKTDKKLLVLAMKASFYISDSQIKKICEIYDLAIDDFYRVIQYLKNSLMDKNDKRVKAEQRRNFAYYHHKRYNLQLDKMAESENKLQNLISDSLKTKQDKHERNWQKMNKKLEEGYLYLRPTTKSIADLLGICERQVTYYINCARKELESKNGCNHN